MREQINKYARGTFEYNVPAIRLKENSINETVDLNRGFTGYICFDEVMKRPLKGIAYSGNDKVVLKNNVFAGEEITLEYSIKCDGTMSGSIISGCFDIVSNAGEYRIPYSFSVSAGSFDTSSGQIRNLEQFAVLFRDYPSEAAEIFESSEFKNIFIGNDLKLRNVYNGLVKGPDVNCNIEEFLVFAHKKNKIKYTLPVKKASYSDVTENFRDSIVIERDTWGYSRIFVRVEADFIHVERSFIDTEMFIGNAYELQYIVDASRLHRGYNYGRIIFESLTGKVEYSIEISQFADNVKNIGNHEVKSLNLQLTNLYISFRTHKINISDWIRDSKIILEKIREIDDSNPFYRLAEAQLYIVGHNEEQAKLLIENVKDEIDTQDISGYPLYCYFIYINTLYNKDRAYSRRAASVVRECYKVNEDWRILWTLLFMDEEFEQNPSLKMVRLKEQFNKGCQSPIIYIEACNALNDNTSLLRVLNTFEINVLMFGARHGILNEKLTDLAVEMLLGNKIATKAHLNLLQTLYDMNKSVRILECLCKMYIRAGIVGENVLPYYEKAIENELKITQLFEYYIMSRNRDDMSPLPKMLLMYFGYNNSLDYRQKSYLYANIIANRAENIQVYNAYLSQMELFVDRQLMAGHINAFLAAIYEHIVRPEMVNNENAGQISEIYYTYLVECHEPSICSVIVRHKESNSEKEYRVSSGIAYVRIYTEDAAIILVDNDGRRYIDSAKYKLTKMLHNEDIIRKCLEMDRGLVHIRLAFCDKFVKYPQKKLDIIEFITGMVAMPEMSKYYRNILLSTIIEYYYDNYDNEGFDRFISKVDLNTLCDNDLTKIIELFIIEGRYQEAYKLVKQFSAGYLMPKRLAKLCSRVIEAKPEPEGTLLALSYDCFDKGLADDNILEYLTMYYNGPTLNMVCLWRNVVGTGINTYDLEERIIAQMMFSHTHMPDIYEIFDSYYIKGPKERIVEAYLTYHSYEYFVCQKPIAESVFDTIEVCLENEMNLAKVCKMALAMYYSGKEELNEFQKEIAENIVFELARHSLVFPFLKKLKRFIRLPFDVTDKTMIELRAKPTDKIIIHYEVASNGNNKKYVSEEMVNVYEGIFVKSFVMFYGEGLKYYISRETPEGEEVLESRVITNTGSNPDKSIGRFEQINDMIECNGIKDKETLMKLMHSYAVTDCVTRQLFKPL